MPSFELQHSGDGHVLRLSGELDLGASHELEATIARLFADDPTALIVDLRGLTFIDSTGLKLLLLINERVTGSGCALGIVPGPPPVRRVFELTGLSEALPWIDLGPGADDERLAATM